MENQENNTETKPKTSSMFEGVSSQINLGPQSELHKRFARLYNTSGREVPPKEFVAQMMTAFENQPDDNSGTIADLRSEIAAYEATLQNQELEIEQLKEQLAEARNEANENATKGLGQLAQIEDMKQQLDGAIIVRPNPVSAHFLNEMAESENTTPAKILEKLFMDDLQNPRANNLPYTVSASDIRKVMEQLKNQPEQ